MHHLLARVCAVIVVTAFVVVGIVGCGGGGNSTPTVSVTATPATLDPGQSSTITATVTHDAGEGVTWTVSGGGTLSNQTSSTVTYTAPSTATAATTATVTATSVKNTSVSASATININPSLTITTAAGALTAGQVGGVYSTTLAASGGTTPYTWSIAQGTLPTGLTLSSSTGTISGTPVAPSGTASFTVKLTDADSVSTSSNFTIAISPAPAITFGTTVLANATFGTSYTASISATGGAGTLTYTLASGSLPAGLSLSTAGAITGTPTAGGTSTFAVKAADSFGDSATSPSLSIVVGYPALSITTATTLPTGIVGTAYSQTLAATGGSGTGYTYTVFSGTGLSAAGLTLSSAGSISGTPSAAELSGTFTVQVTDSASNKATALFTLTIDAALSISQSTLPFGVVSSPYTATLTATGGSGSGYEYSVTSGTGLSAVGLTLSSGGAITGTPSGSESAVPVAIQVTDSLGNKASSNFSVTIYPSFAITTSTLPAGIVGTPYNQTLSASGGTGTGYSYSVTSGTGLSAVGLSLSTAGVISGTPTASETSSSVTIQVTDSLSNKASATLSITIYPSLSITTSSLPIGIVGTAYSTTLAATGGSGGYAFTVTSGTALSAAGLTLSTSGIISGIPTTAEGSAGVTVQVTDSAGNKASTTLTLTIDATFSITTTSIPAGLVGKAYSANIVASGGSGSGYQYTVTSGTGLSAVGLSLSTAGAITGTPTVTETNGSFTVQATDSASNKTSAQFTLTINPLLAITTTSIPNGTVGTAYNTTLAATGGSGTGYAWTVTTGTGLSAVGLSLSSAGVISGTPTAPETATAFTVQVTDSLGNMTTATLGLIVSYGSLNITTTNLPGATVSTAYSETFNATGGSGNYSWSIISGLSSLQNIGLSFTSAGVLSGTLGSSSAGSYPFTVKVTDTTTTNSMTAPYTLLVGTAVAASCTHDGSGNSILNGHYAFLLSGFDSKGNKYDEIGDFTADGSGNIASGNGDANSSGFATSGEKNFTFTGTYAIGSTDNRGIATWTNSNSLKTAYCFAADTITNINGSNVAEAGRIIEADGSGYLLTGFFQIQDAADFTNAAVTGGYAVGLQGVNTGTSGLSRAAVAGVINFDGAGNVTGGQFDTADYEPSTTSTNYQAAVAVPAATYSVGANGRGTMTIAGNPIIFYVVGTGGKLLLLSASNINSNTLLSGQAIQQTTTSFTTSNAKASGAFRSSGNDPNNTPTTDSVQVGQITFDGAGNASAVIDQNDGGILSGPQAMTANYSVTSSGYLTLSNAGKHAPAFYLYAPGSGFGLDGSQNVSLYYLNVQTIPNGGFTGNITGSYAVGTIAPAAYYDGTTQQYPQILDATVTFSPGSISIISDNVSAPGLAGDIAVGQTGSNTFFLDPTYGATTGRFVVQNNGTTNVIGYIVSPTTVFLINANSGSDGLTLQADHQ